MRCAVIYHSRWGNCREIAESVAAGLSDTGNDVYVVEIGSAAALDLSLECILLGCPTTGGKASRPMRRFIKRAVTSACAGKEFVAFGTGLQAEIAKSNPQAGDEIHEMLAKRGMRPLAPPFKAAVVTTKGPLAEGEVDRALQFGRDLGRSTPFEIVRLQKRRQDQAV